MKCWVAGLHKSSMLNGTQDGKFQDAAVASWTVGKWGLAERNKILASKIAMD